MLKQTFFFIILQAWLLGGMPSLPGLAADDLMLASRPADWACWEASGEAFGSRPDSGLSRHGRGSRGTLTSPVFTIDRPFLNFEIAGGTSDKLRLELLVDDKVVRATSNPFADETLNPTGLNVSDFLGKPARVRLRDDETEGVEWLQVADLRLSDRPPSRVLHDVQRTISLENPLLLLPVASSPTAPRRKLTLLVDGEPIRIFRTSLAQDGRGDWWLPIDVSRWQGKQATITIERMVEGAAGLDAIHPADTTPGDEQIYREMTRPQFHFSPSRGWMGDPNGLVYHNGVWHLFWQHNPFGLDHANMCWGHAVSRDLFHWTERPVAIFNDYADGGLGSIYSGGGFLDTRNTAGFQRGEEEVIVLAFLATARGPSLAFSTDAGRNFQLYSGNPVIPDGGWDPKIIWFEPTQQWVMATSKSQRPGGKGVTFYTSTDLINWSYQSWIEDCHECPELFELPVDGDRGIQKWMMYGNKGPYFIGRFNGKVFDVEFGPFEKQSGGACQTWSNTPDGRRIEVGMAGRVAGMPSLGIQSLPVEVTLHTMSDGTVRARKRPVRELEGLRTRRLCSLADVTLEPGTTDLCVPADGMFDLVAEFDVAESEVERGLKFGFSYRGQLASYDSRQPQRRDVLVRPENGVISIRIVVDRVIHETFMNDGLLYEIGFHGAADPAADRTLRLVVENTAVTLRRLEVYELGKANWSPFSSRQLIQEPSVTRATE